MAGLQACSGGAQATLPHSHPHVKWAQQLVILIEGDLERLV